MQVLPAPVLVERTIAGFSVNGTVAGRLDGPDFDSDWDSEATSLLLWSLYTGVHDSGNSIRLES